MFHLKFDATQKHQILSGRFFQILWPSQNIQTLLFLSLFFVCFATLMICVGETKKGKFYRAIKNEHEPYFNTIKATLLADALNIFKLRPN